MTHTLNVGEILKPQGIRGELKVKPFTDDAEVFHSFSRVFVEDVPYKVLSVRTGGGIWGSKESPTATPPNFCAENSFLSRARTRPRPPRADITLRTFWAAPCGRRRGRCSAPSPTCAAPQRTSIRST